MTLDQLYWYFFLKNIVSGNVILCHSSTIDLLLKSCGSLIYSVLGSDAIKPARKTFVGGSGITAFQIIMCDKVRKSPSLVAHEKFEFKPSAKV